MLNFTFSEAVIVGWIRQIVSALGYIHHSQIIHRDIKPNNLLLKNDVVKIADFGMATYCPKPDGRKLTIFESNLYSAPEFAMRKDYSFEVDLWSLGVSLYVMLNKKFPLSKE